MGVCDVGVAVCPRVYLRQKMKAEGQNVQMNLSRVTIFSPEIVRGVKTQFTNGAGRQLFEYRRTVIEMGSPTQSMCMTTPIIIIFMENGYFLAADSGTTMRFIKK